MKNLEFTFELFEENCEKQGIATFYEKRGEFSPYQKYLDRCNYAEKYFMCMRMELEKAVPQLEDEIQQLRNGEAPFHQVANLKGQRDIINTILGIRRLDSKVKKHE